MKKMQSDKTEERRPSSLKKEYLVKTTATNHDVAQTPFTQVEKSTMDKKLQNVDIFSYQPVVGGLADDVNSQTSSCESAVMYNLDNNFKRLDAGMDRWGRHRLALATFFTQHLLSKLKAEHQVDFFIENGTLLGAFRNQRFIPHDDDFDFGIILHSCPREIFKDQDSYREDWTRLCGNKLLNSSSYVGKAIVDCCSSTSAQFDSGSLVEALATVACIDEMQRLCDKLNELLEKCEKSSQYKARLVNTYALKIELFEPQHGSYPFIDRIGEYFHYVTVDIQAYQPVNFQVAKSKSPGTPDGANAQSSKYNHLLSLYFMYKNPVIHKWEQAVPLSVIQLEGETFPAPNNPEAFLKNIYGSLSPLAKYNPETAKYELK